MLVAMCSGIAQMMPGPSRVPSLGSGVNMDFLRRALEQNMVIIRSQYLLVDNGGNYYGYGGDSIFGESFEVAIKCGRGLVGYRGILCPWEADAKFADYSNSSDYRPLLSSLKVSPVCDELTYAPYWYELTSMRRRFERGSDDQVLTILNDTTAYGNLAYQSVEGSHLRGFMVWATPEDDVFGSSHGRLKLSFSSPEVTFDNGVSQELDLPLGVLPMAGFYIIPKALPNGMIQLCMAGVAFAHNSGGKYRICAIDNPSGVLQGTGITPVNPQTVAPAQIDPSVIQDI